VPVWGTEQLLCIAAGRLSNEEAFGQIEFQPPETGGSGPSPPHSYWPSLNSGLRFFRRVHCSPAYEIRQSRRHQDNNLIEG